MKKNMRKSFVLVLMIFALMMSLCACGSDNEPQNNDGSVNNGSFDSATKANETYFEWEGNLITALSADGSKQESLLIPARCEGFSGVVFQGSSVKHVAFEDEDDITLDFAFMGADNIISLKLPGSLTVVPSMSFKGCKQLEKIAIPAKVIEIQNYAFSGCAKLKELVFDGNLIASIPDNCFEDCEALSEITLPEGIKTIGKYAFFNCTALKNVNLASSINEIAKFAFGNTGITEIHFPKELEITTMDTSAFGTNAYTTTVYVANGSWCDSNRESWDIGFKEIKGE